MNLLEETLSDLKENGKSPSDVRWVGSPSGYALSWNNFTKIANIEYDDGFGGQEIATDLVIVGDDWWMERKEYDGSEKWSFKFLPAKPNPAKHFASVKNGDSWATIEDMNKEGGKSN